MNLAELVPNEPFENADAGSVTATPFAQMA
jgi:hypothetical protein